MFIKKVCSVIPTVIFLVELIGAQEKINIVTVENYTDLELCGGRGFFSSIELPCDVGDKLCVQKISSKYFYSSAQFTYVPEKDVDNWKVQVTVAGDNFNRSINQDRVHRCLKDKTMKIKCEEDHLQANQSYTLQYLYEFNGHFAGTKGPYKVQVTLMNGQDELEICVRFPIEIKYDDGTHVGSPCYERLSSCAFYDSECSYNLTCQCRFGDFADPITCKRHIGLVCEQDSDCIPTASCTEVQNKSWSRECTCGFWDKTNNNQRMECVKNLWLILGLTLGILGAILIVFLFLTALKYNGQLCLKKTNLTS